MDNLKYDPLKLENQFCFPLYACSKEVIRHYRLFLDGLDLTYTQYIAMMVLWEHDMCNVKELGQRLYLDSGTLTPVLKSLEKKGYVRRARCPRDERILEVCLTREGRALREQAVSIPLQMGAVIHLEPEEKLQLHQLLHKILTQLQTTSDI